jgi:hypothetical protein
MSAPAPLYSEFYKPYPFRWIFPLGQLLLCMFLLAVMTAAPFFLAWQMRNVVSQSIVALNLPGLFLQLPEAILRADHMLWSPPGIDNLIWQAFRSSLAGMLFWWMAGRATEALVSIPYRQLKPRISWAEAIIGFVLMAGGATFLVGALVFGTPADRADVTFRRFAAGGGLWALLGALSVIARFRQWRLRKPKASARNMPVQTIQR